MAESCELHCFEWERTALDKYLAPLPQYQGGKGQHKCPYCAYNLGYEHGYQQGYEQALRVLKQYQEETWGEDQ